jgi:type IV pilus assembly protein PilA
MNQLFLNICSKRTVAKRRREREAGFTLMELLIVISIMLILMLIAIPNFSNMKSQANETSATASLRAIYEAQIQYQTNFPANGFACSLATLGGNPASGPPTPQAAQVLDTNLATGQKSGYTFNIVNCTKVTVNNQDMYTGYEATAVPQAVGKTGHRGFCIDQQGEIKSDPTGGTNCTVALQ